MQLCVNAIILMGVPVGVNSADVARRFAVTLPELIECQCFGHFEADGCAVGALGCGKLFEDGQNSVAAAGANVEYLHGL